MKNSWIGGIIGGAVGLVVGIVCTALVITLIGGGLGSSIGGKKIEGSGYKSAEDAVSAYISYWQKGDYDGMVSCFAVETYVENYDLEAALERKRTYSALTEYVPNISEQAKEINKEKRLKNIYQYLGYQYVNYITDMKLDVTKSIAVQEDGGRDFIREYFESGDDDFYSEIEFKDFCSFKKLGIDEYYDSDNCKKIIKNLKKNYGADDYEEVIAELEIDSDTYYLFVACYEYDGKWYIGDLGGMASSYCGIPLYMGGLVPEDYESN